MVKRGNRILCGVMLVLIPGLILGLTIGSSTENDAQAFNNGQHLDTWWVDTPLLGYANHIVYHTTDDYVYEGWHVIQPGNRQVQKIVEEIVNKGVKSRQLTKLVGEVS